VPYKNGDEPDFSLEVEFDDFNNILSKCQKVNLENIGKGVGKIKSMEEVDRLSNEGLNNKNNQDLPTLNGY